jgi:hypothetical protein
MTVAAVRRLTQLGPEGAPAALVAYLAHARSEEVEEEILDALVRLTAAQGKVDLALHAALRDPGRVRRAAAALVLGRFGDAGQRAAVREVLRNDLYLSVRLRAAQGLLATGDAATVPVLLGILADGSPDLAKQAEELLRQAAGPGAPALPLGEGAARRKCSAAWEAWWRTRRDKPALEKVEVDLLAANLNGRARNVASRFINAAIKADLAVLRATTDVPFTVEWEKTFQARADLDAFLQEVVSRPREEVIRVVSMRVLLLEQYAPMAEAKDRKKFLHAVNRPGVRVVVVQLNGTHEIVPLFVRVRGSRARVIGIGQERNVAKPGAPS